MVQWVQSGWFKQWAHKLFAVLVVLSVFLPSIAFAVSNPFFTTRTTSFTDLSAFTKWTSVMPRYERQAKEPRTADAKRWDALLETLKGKPLATQMKEVNDFFNGFAYIEDRDNYGVEDYWATPYELMKRGGDCDDYAIAKYISLKRLGVPEASMRIMIVQDNNLNGIMHAVLEVRAGSARYLLDNQVKSVVDQQNIFHYRPIYAINHQNWWAYQ